MSTREKLRQKKVEYWTAENTPKWANRWTALTAFLMLYAIAGVAFQGYAL
jgi:hypothetical protein